MTQNPFSDLQVDEDSCFICGTRSDITQEHVFAKWVQHGYDLWDKRIALLNDTFMQYRNLRIPCCKHCNGVDLGRLERLVSDAVARGYEGVKALGERPLYLWTAKIFFGILRKELSLLRDRRQPEAGTIVPEGLLRSFSNLHLFLQGVRGRHDFDGPPPYSVLLFNLHDVGGEHRFGFRDSTPYMTLSVRMGEVGVIVAFEDGGLARETFGRYALAVAGRKLHPIQFDEVFAKVSYQMSLVETGLKYLTSDSDGDHTPVRTSVVSRGLPTKAWSQRAFSEVLRVHLSDWTSAQEGNIKWYEPPDRVQTWMVGPSGELLLKAHEEWTAGVYSLQMPSGERGTGGAKFAEAVVASPRE